MRGVAALFVVMEHYSQQFGPARLFVSVTRVFEQSYLWVDFFFILSGFVLAYTYGAAFHDAVGREGYLRFMGKRIARVWPLHILVLIAFIPTEAAKLLVHNTADPAFVRNNLTTFTTNALLIQSWWLHDLPSWNEPSWSISAELASYLCFPFLALSVARLRRVPALLAVIGACVIGLLLLERYEGAGRLDMHIQGGVARCFLEFVIGIVLARFHADDTARALFSRGVVVWASLGVALAVLHAEGPDIIAVIAMAVLIYALSANTGRTAAIIGARPMYFLGEISYSIYMVHALVMRLWIGCFQLLFHGHLADALVLPALAANYAAVILLSTLTYRFIEKPGRGALTAFFNRRLDRTWPAAVPAVER